MSEPARVKALMGPWAELLGLSGHPCAYLPREATDEVWIAHRLEPEAYHDLMDAGFRRSGRIVYRPRCEGCRACIPIRVPVADFRPSKSQRRARNRNRDLVLRMGEPDLTPEKTALYARYLARKHGREPEPDLEQSLREFLYESCVDTREIEYRDGAGKLVAVSIVDVCPRSMSSVYHFFDPGEARRSVGVASVVTEIELCRELGLPFYYLGFWVQGCPAMEYKANYRTCEVLREGTWQPVAGP
jgi:arginine-tRNA-protein transferase